MTSRHFENRSFFNSTDQEKEIPTTDQTTTDVNLSSQFSQVKNK